MTRIMDDARFMRAMGVFMLAMAALAFTPRYFGPLASGQYAAPSPWMHPHAISALAWSVIFIIQPWLIVQKNPALHRRVGYLAIVVAVVNVISGVAVQLDLLPTSPGDVSNIVGGGFRLFHSTPAFVVFLIAALAMRRRADWHLRFMYQTAIAAIATIIGRIYIYYLGMEDGQASILIPVANLLFVLALPVYDFVKYRKVHSASWIGVAAFVGFQLVASPIVFSQAWVNFATGQ